MFDIPPAGDNSIRIFGMDPGTDTLGVCIIDVDLETSEPLLIYGTTLRAAKLSERYPEKIAVLGGKDVRIEILCGMVRELLIASCPTVVIAESPFHRPGRTNAFEALVECFKALRQTVWYYSPTLTLRRVDPVTAKNYLGVSHQGDSKLGVRNKLLEFYENRQLDSRPMDSFDEHTFDAGAVCHYGYRAFYLKEIVESSRKKKKRRNKRGKK